MHSIVNLFKRIHLLLIRGFYKPLILDFMAILGNLFGFYEKVCHVQYEISHSCNLKNVNLYGHTIYENSGYIASINEPVRREVVRILSSVLLNRCKLFFHVSAIATYPLAFLREGTAVYCDSHTKHKLPTLCRKVLSVLML